MSLFIQKYGGTSVGTLERIRNVAEHIAETHRQGHLLVIVVSAMGQQTDDLLEMALTLNKSPPQREVDMLLSVGERISMSLLAIALSDLKVPTISLTGSQSGILTNNTHGNAQIKQILGDRIRTSLELGTVVIVAGFQGMSDPEKEITTLGRGGSDLTAIALAQVLKADRCQIFKDVDGVCSSDPRLVDQAKVISAMSWATLSDLTWHGSGVVHHRGVHIAKKFEIPLEIRSSFNLNTPGTIVGRNISVEKAVVYAVTHRQDLSWLILKSCKIKALSKVLRFTQALGEQPLFIQQQQDESGTRIELVISSKFKSKLTLFASKDLVGTTLSERASDLACISLIGDGFWQDPDLLDLILSGLSQEPRLFDYKNSVANLLILQKNLTGDINVLHQNLIVERDSLNKQIKT